MKAKLKSDEEHLSKLVRPTTEIKPLLAAGNEDIDDGDLFEREEPKEHEVEINEDYNEDEARKRFEEELDSYDPNKEDNKRLSHEMAMGESEEGRNPKIKKSPIRVTKAEREAHECTHTPYRSWCKHCVRARGVNKAHRRQKTDAETSLEKVPRVSMDY